MIGRGVALAMLLALVACAQEPTAPPTARPTVTPPPPTPTPTPPWFKDGWTLVWQDEFTGEALDAARWSIETGGDGWGNSELQSYSDRPENVRVEDGHLIVEAHAEEYRHRDYTSARLRTLGKGDWTYGRIEVRARLPEGQGIWPAIWMMPSTREYGGWPAGGEIDIMELLGHEPNTVHGTLHYGDVPPNNVHTGDHYTLPSGSFGDAFHVFALEWEAEAFRWYVDDELVQTQTRWYTREASYPAPFDRPFHLILNVAVGGNWPGPPDDTTTFPQQMVVDYVRVYQLPTESQR